MELPAALLCAPAAVLALWLLGFSLFSSFADAANLQSGKLGTCLTAVADKTWAKLKGSDLFILEKTPLRLHGSCAHMLQQNKGLLLQAAMPINLVNITDHGCQMLHS